jgi:hypothetical protein
MYGTDFFFSMLNERLKAWFDKDVSFDNDDDKFYDGEKI